MNRRLHIVTVSLAAMLAIVFASTTRADDAAVSEDGLELVKVKNIDKLYKRPGASLQGYKQILFKPVTVAFSKHWHPKDYGTFGLSSKDVERIRADLAQVAEERFRKVLTEGGYAFVSQSGPGVLEVEAQIQDLFINAPDTRDASRSQTYVMDAGSMRMLATLSDSVAGTTLYRAVDRSRGRNAHMEWVTPGWNMREAQQALDIWAKQLKSALDAAKES